MEFKVNYFLIKTKKAKESLKKLVFLDLISKNNSNNSRYNKTELFSNKLGNSQNKFN